VNLEAALPFGDAFIELIDQKGWDVPDTAMEQQTVHIP